MAAASVSYYALALATGQLLIDLSERHLPLRHSHHRYLIDGPHGTNTLTIPLVASTHHLTTPMREVRISEHGHWRGHHWGAICAAYGRSPYFSYVADDLQHIIYGEQSLLADFNQQIHNLVIDFMDLPISTQYTHNSTTNLLANSIDLRPILTTKHTPQLPTAIVPYYQMWDQTTGFKPHLSILDLMMNYGREGILVLHKMATIIKTHQT